MEIPTKKYKNQSIIDLEKIAELEAIILGKLYEQGSNNLNVNDKLSEDLKVLIGCLKHMVNEKIEFRKYNIAKSTKFDNLISSLNNLLITLKEKAEQFNFDNIDNMLPYIEKLSGNNTSNANIDKIVPVDETKKI